MKQRIEKTYLHPLLQKLKALCPSLTANQITLARLAPAGLAYIKNDPWLYLLAALLDWADGAWARANSENGPLGRYLDPAVDKVIVLFWLWALYNQGVLPLFWVTAMTGLDAISQVAYGLKIFQKHGANVFGKSKKVLQDSCIMAGILFHDKGDLASLFLIFSAGAALLSLGAKFQLKQTEKTPAA